MTESNDTSIPANLTAEEKELLDTIAKDRGWDFVEQHWHLILEQARALGEID